MTIASPSVLLIAAIISAIAIFIAWRRRIALGGSTILLSILALILLSLTAGDPHLRWVSPPKIAVMLDASASTRGASYHDRKTVAARISELLGSQKYAAQEFAGEPSADRTIFTPPPADAIVLFSDCQFELPATAPPTYIVVDPTLEATGDARVARLEIRGSEAAASIVNGGAPRVLEWEGAEPSATTAPRGSTVQVAHRRENANHAVARLDPGDLWPENDALSVRASPPLDSARWWIGGREPGAPWMHFSPGELPADSAAYLAPSIIVLDNASATEFTTSQLTRVEQYVRDLGGALLILGGDRAFAAGAYTGTALEHLSPLSSDPPEPTRHWILLADSSGSMAAPVSGDQTRWSLASAALLDLIPSVPQDDLLSIGSFAREVRWWCRAVPAKNAAAQAQPMAALQPRGPTDLEFALAQVLGEPGADLPTELLVLTDAQAEFLGDPAALATALADKHIRVSVLALAPAPPDFWLRRVVGKTGGHWHEQAVANQWSADARQLLRAVSPAHLARAATRVEFINALGSLAPNTVELSNNTWLKRDASELAHARDRPMAALWKVGSGKVIATAFSPTPQEVYAMTQLIARPPRDPRFRVTVDADSSVHVTVNAIDRDQFLNRLPLSVELNGRTVAMKQTAPGQYEVDLDAPREPSFVTIRSAGQLLDRVAIAGRYAAEFDAIGNNHEKMGELAARTAGAVIEPNDNSPIQFNPRRAVIPIGRFLAFTAALCVTFALISWKRGGLVS